MTVLPTGGFLELINDDEQLLENSFVVPDAALANSGPRDLAMEHLLSNGRDRACETRSHLWSVWMPRVARELPAIREQMALLLGPSA